MTCPDCGLECRYTGVAPWGDFYELTGPDPKRDLPTDWQAVGADGASMRHFLFYMKDETFEIMAAGWRFEPVPDNALMRLAAAP